MDRRSFLVLALAGAADPMQAAKPVALQNPAPIPYTALNGGDAAVVPGFDDWLSGFRARLLLDGWPDDLVDRELTGLTPDPRVVAADNRQPEFAKPLSDYVKGVVTDDRVREGQGYMSSLTFLPAVDQRFGALAASRATWTCCAAWPPSPRPAAGANSARARSRRR